MVLQDAMFLPFQANYTPRFSKICDRGESLWTITFLENVALVSKGMLHVKYLCFIKSSFLSQSNFIETTTLSQS